MNNILSPGEKFFQEVRKTTFRKEEFEYIHTGIIDEDGESWTTTELDEANIFQVYNQYRAKHGIPFPDEIIAIRKHYGISAAKMSQILGFGINQYRLYEEGEVPNISNARTIIAATQKNIFLSFLEASKNEMTDSEYRRIKNKIESTESYMPPIGKSTDTSGYRALSLSKIEAVVKKIISTIGPTFVTKMNKLLFYVDFINYKRHGYGVTGVTYRALQFGPVPDSWGKIYGSLQDLCMNEHVYPSGQSGILLDDCSKTESCDLSDHELQTIEDVCQLFSELTAGEISEISHKEKGWIDNAATHSEISYQKAFELNYN